MTLEYDIHRVNVPETGIFVRAKVGDTWGSVDISHLKIHSLVEWMRSRGGKNAWAEQTVCILLGYSEEEISGVDF